MGYNSNGLHFQRVPITVLFLNFSLSTHKPSLSILNESDDTAIKPTDLRGILKYVPQFRNHIFVISLDGSIVADENFSNVITDIAVLRSLNIRIVLIHGIGYQLRWLAEERGINISDIYGSGPTDEKTLKLATEASALVTHKIAEALTQAGLQYATTNAVRASEIGILKGIDHGATGKVDKLDLNVFHTLLEREITPLLTPIMFDREGRTLRVNSDQLATEVAVQLKASKLIYLTPFEGLIVNQKAVQNIPVEELRRLIQRKHTQVDARLLSKAHFSIEALDSEVPRAHILDGRIFGGLLTEIFDKVGLGTMIHANEYQRIRPARKKDVQSIHNITRTGARTDALRPKTRQMIEHSIGDFFVYEIDDSIIGCAALTTYPRCKTLELGSVYVHNFYEGKGVGRKLVEYAILEARGRKANKLIALSTQAYDFFTRTCGFIEGTVNDLPAARRQEYQSNGRNSRILVKSLNH